MKFAIDIVVTFFVMALVALILLIVYDGGYNRGTEDAKANFLAGKYSVTTSQVYNVEFSK